MRLASITALCLAATAVAAPRLVAAHAEEPNAQTIFTIDEQWVLRANVGVVRSAAPHELICEEVFHGGYSWTLGVLGPTRWVTFGEGGVFRTEDGCDFEEVLALDRRPTDGTAHPPSDGAAFILNREPNDSGLYVSTDGGASFRLIQSFDPATQQTTGVRYLDADTVIVSGYDRTDRGAGLVWRVDVHTGAATELAIPDDISYPYILAATPASLLLLGRRGQQVVFWGPPDDIGRNELVVDTWPTWAVLTDQGRRALISGVVNARGVYIGELDDLDVATWEPFATDAAANCVEPFGEDLWVCGIGRIDGYDVAQISPDGTLQPVLDFRDFSGIRADCPAGSDVPTVCGPVWAQLAPYFGLAPFPDAGNVGPPSPDIGVPEPLDAGADGGDPPAPTAQDGGCCATTPARHDASWFVGALLLALLARRRWHVSCELRA